MRDALAVHTESVHASTQSETTHDPTVPRFSPSPPRVLRAAPALAQQVELDTTAGKIRIELYPDAAPKTVENFLAYVKARHYDGTQFHRVIDGFMIQGGGFTTDFKQKPTRPPMPNEAEQSSARPACSNVPGTIAMARTSRPELGDRRSSSSTSPTTSSLNFREPTAQGYGYTVFGKVVDGMDVVNKIAKAPTGAGPEPLPEGRAGRAGRDQEREGRRRASERARPVRRDPMVKSCTPTTATSRSSSTTRTRRRPSRTSCSTCATATTTTRCSTA